MAITINGELIDNETIEQEFRHVKSEHERRLQVACCERDKEFLEMAKDNLVSRALLNQEALRRFPEVNESDLEERLERLKAQAGGEEAFFEQFGPMIPDPEMIHAMVANGVRVDKTMQEVYGEETEPREAEIEEFYQINAHLYVSSHQVRVSHLSISPTAHHGKWEVYQEMRAFRQQILAGADIEGLAQQHNSNQEFPPDLGWFQQGQFMEEFETLAFSMNEGEVSPVFMTQMGYHIFRVTGVRLPTSIPLAEIREHVVARFIEHRRDLKFNEFLVDLKAKAELHDDLKDAL